MWRTRLHHGRVLPRRELEIALESLPNSEEAEQLLADWKIRESEMIGCDTMLEFH